MPRNPSVTSNPVRHYPLPSSSAFGVPTVVRDRSTRMSPLHAAGQENLTPAKYRARWIIRRGWKLCHRKLVRLLVEIDEVRERAPVRRSLDAPCVCLQQLWPVYTGNGRHKAWIHCLQKALTSGRSSTEVYRAFSSWRGVVGNINRPFVRFGRRLCRILPEGIGIIPLSSISPRRARGVHHRHQSYEPLIAKLAEHEVEPHPPGGRAAVHGAGL